MRRLREQRGVTLIELLVVMSILMAVIGASLVMLEGASRDAPKEQARSSAIQTAQLQLDRMTRELRQAARIRESGYNYVDFEVLSAGTTRRVLFDCRSLAQNPHYRACTRREGSQTGPLGAPVLIVDNLINGTDDTAGRVFTADDPVSPRFFKVRIEVPASGGQVVGFAHHVVLDDGVYLRNLNLG